jgi:putative endopeptidase
MKKLLIALLGASSLTACSTTGGTNAMATAEQTATVSTAAAGPVAPADADRPQIGSFGFDVAGMDRNVGPGDNFYQFANGGWEDATSIPADKSNYGMFTMLADLSLERSREILEEAAQRPGSRIGDLYSAFMDEAAANAAGLRPIQPQIDQVKGVSSKADWAALAGEFLPMGVKSPFAGYVTTDDKQPTQTIVRLGQNGLGLPDRDYYLKADAALAEKKRAYLGYLTKLLEIAGEPNAATRAAAVLAFEEKIARVHWTRVENRDDDKTYNKWTRAQLAQRAPGFDWARYLDAAGFDGQQQFLVSQPSAFTGSAKIVQSTPLPVLKDYLLLHLLDTSAPYLSSNLADANFNYHGRVLNGTPENEVRWKRAVQAVEGALGDELSQIYVERHFPPEAKAKADELVRNVTAAMDRRLQNLTWMTPETKVKARAKLAAFTPKIGYPDSWRDYSSVEISRGDLVGSLMNANRFEWQRNLSKLGKPVDRSEWFMTPMTVNAYANPTWNEIVFPAAILQPPFFDPNADPAINYGGIGAVIGHEISHHFDDQGSKYDQTGALREWWTPEDVRQFNALTGQLVAQYDLYEPLPGQRVQGKLTLGENIADLAGLTVAYDAYNMSLGGQPAPVLGGFTGEQRFYLGWAQVWRRSYREANLLQRLLTDPHSPSEQRAAVVRNLDPWYSAFSPAEGSTLYLPPEKRVRIW